MKLNKIILGSLIAVLSISSCSEDKVILSKSNGVIQFKASINSSVSTKIEDSWSGNETVGVFMVDQTNSSIVSGISNKSYSVSSSGVLSPKDNIEAKFPEDGTKVRFIAYYPYQDNIENNIYKVNLAAEGDNDLLYENLKETFDKTHESEIPLLFKHQLSKLILNVKYNNVYTDGITANILRNSTADFNLITGNLSGISSKTELAMTVEKHIASSLIIPGIDESSKVVFMLNGKKFTWDISSIDFKPETQYTYNINLKDPSVPVDAKLVSSIKEWITVVGEDQELDPDAPELTYSTPVFTGSLLQNSEISNSKITVSYSNGDASQVEVNTLVSGAAAEGIVVDSKVITLAEGNGSFDLPVTGAPVNSGNVTFSITAGSKQLTVVEAIVEAGVSEEPVYTSNLSKLPDNPTANPGGGFVSIDGNDYAVLKLGSSGATGTWTSEVIGEDKKELKFYASAWSGKSGSIKITVMNGGLIDEKESITIDVNSFLSGTQSPFSLSSNFSPTENLYSYKLSGITSSSTIKIESLMVSDKRAILFGLNVK